MQLDIKFLFFRYTDGPFFRKNNSLLCFIVVIFQVTGACPQFKKVIKFTADRVTLLTDRQQVPEKAADTQQ